MHKIDISQPVMNRVVGFEKKQISYWKIRFRIILTTLILVLLIITLLIIQSFIKNGSWDFLTVFSEDWEIICEFWQDTVISFWMEAPQLEIITGCIVLLIISGVIILTRRKRKLINKKLNLINNTFKERN
jgi:hypothetical protein